MPVEATWWNAQNVQMVDRPKAPVFNLRREATRALTETARTGKALRIPIRLLPRTQYFYTLARSHRMRHRVERNGQFAYLWWEPKSKRKED